MKYITETSNIQRNRLRNVIDSKFCSRVRYLADYAS